MLDASAPTVVANTPEGSQESLARMVKRWKAGFVHGRVRAHLRKALRIQSLARKFYEPVEIDGRFHEGQRTSEDRWKAIASVLKSCSADNVLDVGCAEGWFIRRAASELGCYALGIEISDRHMAGEIARLHDRIEHTAIMLSRATSASLGKLPKFDVVMCLSVVHHVIRRQGVGAAEDFVRALASRAEKALIFEMGTSDERALKWRSLLEDMPDGQEFYVRQFLGRCGLTNIRLIASSTAFHGNANRLMFVCEPAAT